MDEPLSNLDARLRMDMRVELKKFQASTGSTTVYVTHDQTEAMTMATRVVVMKNEIFSKFLHQLNYIKIRRTLSLLTLLACQE